MNMMGKRVNYAARYSFMYYFNRVIIIKAHTFLETFPTYLLRELKYAVLSCRSVISSHGFCFWVFIY